MAIKIYNTLNRKKEALRPLEANHVKLYVCGITSYDYCHIGHARSALVFDMVVRYLRHQGYKVTFVRNFTDIDDKIINRANEQGVDSAALALRFINEFYVDMDALGVVRPDIEPKATEHINEMIGLITELIDRGLAYQAGSDVYYRVEAFAGYGRLSGRSLQDMQAGARVSINSDKENPMDFALWKGAKPGEPKWASPWGEGRPGWHIECSAMSRKYLGEVFDIHGGGKDLIFPHHENEIAQSCGATGQDFARLWMHHGFVTIKDEKMSKSLGNFLTIREALKHCSAEELRLFIFSTQYRNPLDFTENSLQDARSGLERMYDCLAQIAALPEHGTDSAPVLTEQDHLALAALPDLFTRAMDNDFNTAQALSHLFETVKTLNRIVHALPEQIAEDDLARIRACADSLRSLGGILGLLQQDPATFLAEKREKKLHALTLSEEEILLFIEQRRQARQEKNWSVSDQIRDHLLGHGIVLKDGPEGTTWEVKSA